MSHHHRDSKKVIVYDDKHVRVEEVVVKDKQHHSRERKFVDECPVAAEFMTGLIASSDTPVTSTSQPVFFSLHGS